MNPVARSAGGPSGGFMALEANRAPHKQPAHCNIGILELIRCNRRAPETAKSSLALCQNAFDLISILAMFLRINTFINKFRRYLVIPVSLRTNKVVSQSINAQKHC